LGNFRVLQFERSRFKIAERSESGVRRKHESIPTRELLGSDLLEDRAELHWRLSSPITILILMFVALPLARTRPREGMYGRLLVAVLFFVVYSNLLAVGYAWIEDGKVPASAGLWWAHGAALLIGWLTARSWRRRPRRVRADAEAAA
jgi:lipopolysaccharide export system permease protein